MKKSTYKLIENYMNDCMTDSAHDKEHVYRVLYNALTIADSEDAVDYDVLITACLLHDIGRKEQFENPKLNHAEVGAEKAYQFLREHHFPQEMAEQVRECIRCHRFRRDMLPQSLEAKILFDADKIDVSGAVGIARTLIYKGQVAEPLYSLRPDGSVSDGTNDEKPSFFQEYKYKLENLYSQFYTRKGAQMARERQQAAAAFYDSIFHEVSAAYTDGIDILRRQMEE